MKQKLRYLLPAVCLLIITAAGAIASPSRETAPPPTLHAGLCEWTEGFQPEDETNANERPPAATRNHQPINLDSLYAALDFGCSSNQITLFGWGIYNLAGARKNGPGRRRKRISRLAVGKGLALIALSAAIPDLFSRLFVTAFNLGMDF